MNTTTEILKALPPEFLDMKTKGFSFFNATPQAEQRKLLNSLLDAHAQALVKLAEREKEKEELLQTLQYIWENDKTVYDYRGRDSENRNAELPNGKGERWLTPREIAESTLREFGRSPHKPLPQPPAQSQAGEGV